MRRSMLSILCVVALLAMGASKLSDYEGTKWKVKVSPDDEARKTGERDFDDNLLFKGSMFSSETYMKKGFKPVQYDEDTRRFGPSQFTAEPKSDTDGSMKWSGTIVVNTIQGQITWTKKDGSVLNYSFTGDKAN